MRAFRLASRLRTANAQPDQRQFEPVSILRVTDAQGNVLYNYQPPSGVRLAGAQSTWLIDDILADDQARAETFGAHSYLELDRPAAVKTGTTENFQELWTIGFTPQLVVGVWVGNSNDQPMKNVEGARGAGHIWNAFMTDALKGQPSQKFPRPCRAGPRDRGTPRTGLAAGSRGVPR